MRNPGPSGRKWASWGVGVMPACEETGMPPIVHFHGFGVYNEMNEMKALEIKQVAYRKLISTTVASPRLR